MRLSTVAAIRPYLEQAVGAIDYFLTTLEELCELYDLMEAGKTPPEVEGSGKPELTPEQYAALEWRTAEGQPITDEQREAVLADVLPGQPISDRGDWRRSSRRAAAWLREAGETVAAKTIDEVLNGLPDEPRQVDEYTREAAERVRTILAACLEEQPPATGQGKTATGNETPVCNAADDGPSPPLPDDRDLLNELVLWNAEMLETWRGRKDSYVRDYVMLGRWGQDPHHPKLSEWMLRLTYSPVFGQPDTRLRDPRLVFMLSAPVCEYLPPNRLWHCTERLRRLRENAINHNFDPRQLAPDVERAVYDLFCLPESLGDRLLSALQQTRAKTGAATIPPEFRTCAMTKRKAASYLRKGNADSAVEWLNQCIKDGTISCETLSRQSHVFDVRQFPDNVREHLLPK